MSEERFKPKCIARSKRLVVEPYPSKSQFVAEASRDDCDSYPFLHVEVNHDFMSTVELWNLLDHEWPPCNLPKPSKLKMMELLMKKDAGHPCVLRASNISLDEWHKRDFKKESSWYYSQIYVWYDDSSRAAYRMWIAWCKNLLKRKARYAKGTRGAVYNPFEGLHLRVRVEFHD